MPDTFVQTVHTILQLSLATGAGHTFLAAADTWARITVESNICTRCAADESDARWSKKVSNTRALLSHPPATGVGFRTAALRCAERG